MNALLRPSPNLFHVTEDFVDTAPAALVHHSLPQRLEQRQPLPTPEPLPAPQPLASALREDAARMFDELGLKSVRAAIVDLATQQFDPVWLMSDAGDAADADGALAAADEIQFPGVEHMLAQLRGEPGGGTVTRRLSPRHWALAWRLHDGQAVVAEVRYHDARTLLCDIDTTLVRLVCNSGAQAALAARGQDDAGAAAQRPASGERRQRRQDLRRPRHAALALSVLSAVLAAGLAVASSGGLVDPSDREPLRVAMLTLGAAVIGVALLLAWQGRRTRRASD